MSEEKKKYFGITIKPASNGLVVELFRTSYGDPERSVLEENSTVRIVGEILKALNIDIDQSLACEIGMELVRIAKANVEAAASTKTAQAEQAKEDEGFI